MKNVDTYMINIKKKCMNITNVEATVKGTCWLNVKPIIKVYAWCQKWVYAMSR